MYRYIKLVTFISFLLICTSCADNDPPSGPEADGPPYDVGETISLEHQAIEFDFCYPTCPANSALCDDLATMDTTFSFLKLPEKVFMIEISASWWGPCYNKIQYGEEVHEHWETDSQREKVEIIQFLDELNEPYSCLQWGHEGDDFIPSILIGSVIDGAPTDIRDWFIPNPNAGASQYPVIIFIDHNKQIVSTKFGIDGTGSFTPDDANAIIQYMLNAM